MISRKLFNRIRVQIPKFINFCKRCQFPFFKHLHKFHKYFCPVRKFNSMDELAALIHHAADESKAYFAALNGAK